MTMAGASAVTPDRIMSAVWGYAQPLVLAAAVNNRVFDLLEDGPKTVEQMAEISGASARGLRAISNALVGMCFLTKSPDNRYGLTQESEAFLVRSKPGYLGGFVEFSAFDLIPKWLNLHEVVRKGSPVSAVNREEDGDEFFQRLVEPIFALSYHATQALGNILNLKGTQKPVRVLDVGTGSGVWGIGLAQQSPHVSVTAVDWARVLDVTRNMADRFGVRDRFSFLPGDFQSVDFGNGHNLATLGHILHSEGEERSRRLLQKIYRALEPGGTIAITEFLVNQDRTGPLIGVFFAVNMVAHTEAGDTFSFEEISQWLGETGFINPRKIEPGGPASIILAQKPARA